MYEEIIKKIHYTKESIVDYTSWIYYDALSWKGVEWYKVDDLNKKFINYAWMIVAYLIGSFVFCYLILGTNIIHSPVIFAIVLVVILPAMLVALSLKGNQIKDLELEMYIKSCQAIFQYPEFQSDKKHSAIILIHYEKAEIDKGIFDLPLLLIEGFRKHTLPYKIYHVFAPSDFELIFYNNLVADLWIIGHGDHGGFCYGKKRREIDYFSYSKLERRPPKKFIAQLHCNGGDGESLVSINHPDEGYITTRMQTLSQIRYYVIIKMRELDKITSKKTNNSY